MTNGKIDLARGLYDAWNANVPVERLVEQFFAPDAEWHDQPELPGGGIHRGRDAVAKMLQNLEATLGHFEV